MRLKHLKNNIFLALKCRSQPSGSSRNVKQNTEPHCLLNNWNTFEWCYYGPFCRLFNLTSFWNSDLRFQGKPWTILHQLKFVAKNVPKRVQDWVLAGRSMFHASTNCVCVCVLAAPYRAKRAWRNPHAAMQASYNTGRFRWISKAFQSARMKGLELSGPVKRLGFYSVSRESGSVVYWFPGSTLPAARYAMSWSCLNLARKRPSGSWLWTGISMSLATNARYDFSRVQGISVTLQFSSWIATLLPRVTMFMP